MIGLGISGQHLNGTARLQEIFFRAAPACLKALRLGRIPHLVIVTSNRSLTEQLKETCPKSGARIVVGHAPT